MRFVVGFFAFWYDFIVGDDWTVAVGVVIALAATALLAYLKIPVWWLLPLAVVFLLGASVQRVARSSQ